MRIAQHNDNIYHKQYNSNNNFTIKITEKTQTKPILAQHHYHNRARTCLRTCVCVSVCVWPCVWPCVSVCGHVRSRVTQRLISCRSLNFNPVADPSQLVNVRKPFSQSLCCNKSLYWSALFSLSHKESVVRQNILVVYDTNLTVDQSQSIWCTGSNDSTGQRYSGLDQS